MHGQPPGTTFIILLLDWGQRGSMAVQDGMDAWGKRPQLELRDCIL
jgi:hypothetical protein